eukprot:gene11244-11329_t
MIFVFEGPFFNPYCPENAGYYGEKTVPYALRHRWFLLMGAVIAGLPAAIAVGRDVWTTEQGAHGPIILVTGLWLLWRETARGAKPAGQQAARAMIGAMVPLGMLAVYCAIIGKVWLQAAAVYGLAVLVYALAAGPGNVRRAWFPLVYLGFLVPPPPAVIAPLTRALKLGIAGSAADFLAWLGYSTTSLGASLYIDSYELVVAAACAGLNSLTSLLAVGLLYAFLRHRAHPVAMLYLALCALPVAILANFLRVVLLLLVTHYGGNAMAQGLLHDAAGLTTFTLALGVMVLIDMLVLRTVEAAAPLRHRASQGAPGFAARGPVMSRAPLPAPGFRRPALALPSRRDCLAGGLLGLIGAASVLLRPTSTAPVLTDRWIDAAVPQRLGPWQVAARDGLVTAPSDELSARLYDQILTRIYRVDRGWGAGAPEPVTEPTAESASGLARLPDVALLVAYGRGQDTDVQLHRPDACYPAQGFALSDPQALPIRFAGHIVPAQIVTARRDDLVQQVVYWTRIAGMFPPDSASERRVIVRENLAGRMPDAVLVRISVDLPERTEAVAAVLGFIGRLSAMLPPDGRRLLVDGFAGVRPQSSAFLSKFQTTGDL